MYAGPKVHGLSRAVSIQQTSSEKVFDLLKAELVFSGNSAMYSATQKPLYSRSVDCHNSSPLVYLKARGHLTKDVAIVS